MKIALLIVPLLLIANKDGRPEDITPAVAVQPQFPQRRYIPQPAVPEEIRQQRNIERSANTGWLKEETRKYSPESWYLLMSYDSLPASVSAPLAGSGVVKSEKTLETFDYLRGRTKIDLLVSMETNVHEIAHGYFDQNVFRYISKNNIRFNPDNSNGFVFISSDRGFFISFPLKTLFPSSELTESIPDNLRTYRFDTYINGTTSTQSDGVIGLLNELQAYYCGSRYCFDMLEPYKEAAGSDAKGLFEWVTHTQSTMSAFYEFNFFISEYLLYMKRKYSAGYSELRSYMPFRESYTLLNRLYTDLINSYLGKIETEIDLINKDGIDEAHIKDGWLWVRSGDSHIFSGTPLFSDERKTLLPVLEGRRFREIREDF